MSWVYVNSQLVPAETASISPLGSGLLHGAGLFETIRAYQGRYLFQVDAHLERLFASAATIGLEIDYTAAELTAGLEETLAANAFSQDASVRLTVAQGRAMSSDVLITAQPLTQYPETLYQQGLRAIVSQVRRNTTSQMTRVKSLNYLENLIARKQAKSQGADEAIFLDTEGYVAEGAATNLFWVKSGTIYTPSLDRPILPGITRGVALQLAHQLGWHTKEGLWRLNDLLTADEAFLTNALIEVMPLVQVDAKAIGSGTPGATTNRLRGVYQQTVADCVSEQRKVGEISVDV